MEEMRIDDARISVVDNFLLPDEIIKLRQDVHSFPWNPFETDIYKGQKVQSGMIALYIHYHLLIAIMVVPSFVLNFYAYFTPSSINL